MTKVMFAVLLGSTLSFSVALGAWAAEDTTGAPTADKTDQQQSTNQECNIRAGRNQCCSRAGCEGKVLSNRDEHNCDGKSWSAGRGICDRPRL